MAKDVSNHLEALITSLSERFPEAGRDHVTEVVHDVFNQLSAEATVLDHLPALTQRHAQRRLRTEAAASNMLSDT